MHPIDVVLTEIIRNRLVAATEDMANTLIRTAYSPLIFEVKDFAATIMSAQAEPWAETPGVFVFSQGFPEAVRAGIKRWHGRFEPGDVLIVNEPFETGTHISDTNIYVPAFYEGELVAFCGVAAHWADVGGKNPGGWCPDTTDMYQEGLCFRHQKIVAAGTRNQAIWDLIADNVRVPKIVRGDLEAQIAASQHGAKCVQELCRKYGVEVVRTSMGHVIRQTDRAMREMLAKLPDCVSQAAIRLDSDGLTWEGDFRINLTMTKRADEIHFSLAGSGPMARGPINLPGICARGTLAGGVKGLLMPFDPFNAGHTQCIRVELPPASLVNPSRPAPTDSYGYAIVCLLELAFRCLTQILPSRCPAGGYQLTGAFLSRTQDCAGTPFVMAEPLHGGNGATRDADGPTNQLVANGDLPNNPVEVLETRFPVHVERLEYAPEQSGIGKFRGGKGVRKDYRLLEDDCYAALVAENTLDLTQRGVDGGGDGRPGYFVLNPGSDGEQRHTRRSAGIGPLAKGSVIRVVTGGGGGWGPPSERDSERVLSDVRNGFLSPEDALTIYGVRLKQHNQQWVIDQHARESAGT